MVQSAGSPRRRWQASPAARSRRRRRASVAAGQRRPGDRFLHIYTNKYARYRRAPQSATETGNSGLLRTTSDHFSAVPPPTCEVCRRDFGAFGQNGQQRAATDHYGPLLGGSPTYLRGLPTRLRSVRAERAAAGCYGPLFAAPPPISRLICLLAGQSHACMQHPHKDA